MAAFRGAGRPVAPGPEYHPASRLPLATPDTENARGCSLTKNSGPTPSIN